MHSPAQTAAMQMGGVQLQAEFAIALTDILELIAH
jgi:hypothetical protein